MFNNPIKAQQLSTPGVDRPVQDTSVQTALSGFADILSTLGQANKNSGPDAWAVKAEWETEGSQAGIEDAKQYQFLTETQGRAKADVWLNKQVLSRQGGMNADSADSYRQVIGGTIGKSSAVLDREFERKEQERRQEQLNDLELKGAELAMADGAKLGVDPAKLSRDQKIGLAMMANGVAARTQQETANVALATANMNLDQKERVLKSEGGANVFLGQKTVETKSLIFGTIEAIRQNPSKAEAIKLQAISDLQLRKSAALQDAASTVSKYGGDISDVTSGQVASVQAQYDTAIALIRGDYNLDLMKSSFEQLANGTAIEAVRTMPNEMARVVLMQHVTKMPLEASVQTLKKTGTSYNPDSQYEVIRNLGLGVNTALQNTGETPKRWMDTFVAAAPTAAQNESLRPDFAQTLVNTLQESFSAPVGVRQQASSPDSLPSLVSSLARSNLKGEFSQAVADQAAKEGLTPAELWQKSATGVLREKIAPSLQFKDPAVMGNLDVQYSGGKFTVRLKEQQYRTATNLSANPGYYSGIDASSTKINQINKNLTAVQQVLNDYVQSYTKTVGGNPDDVGLALQEVMKLTFNLGSN